MKKVLFITGADDEGNVKLSINSQGQYRVISSGGSNLYQYIVNDLEANGIESSIFITSPLDTRTELKLDKPDLIFNEITNPITHSKALNSVSQIADQLKCSVLNAPQHIVNTRRDYLYQSLTNIDCITVPETIALRPHKAQDILDQWSHHYSDEPVILRKAGIHGGVGTTLLTKQDKEDINDKLSALALDGSLYYLSEFIDYRSDDGLYRKYRFAVIEGVPYIRHMILSENWLIHSDSRNNQIRNTDKIEQSILTRYSQNDDIGIVHSQCKTIFDSIGCEYLGIDCAIDNNGNMLIFEANPNMNILYNSSTTKDNMWEGPINTIRVEIVELIKKKLSLK